jgi:hypothetical protein
VRNIMLHLSAGLPCLHGRLSSNVRPHMQTLVAVIFLNTNAYQRPLHLWPPAISLF